MSKNHELCIVYCVLKNHEFCMMKLGKQQAVESAAEAWESAAALAAQQEVAAAKEAVLRSEGSAASTENARLRRACEELQESNDGE